MDRLVVSRPLPPLILFSDKQVINHNSIIKHNSSIIKHNSSIINPSNSSLEFTRRVLTSVSRHRIRCASPCIKAPQPPLLPPSLMAAVRIKESCHLSGVTRFPPSISSSLKLTHFTIIHLIIIFIILFISSNTLPGHLPEPDRC